MSTLGDTRRKGAPPYLPPANSLSELICAAGHAGDVVNAIRNWMHYDPSASRKTKQNKVTHHTYKSSIRQPGVPGKFRMPNLKGMQKLPPPGYTRNDRDGTSECRNACDVFHHDQQAISMEPYLSTATSASQELRQETYLISEVSACLGQV